MSHIPIRIAITGAYGRMGNELIKVVTQSEQTTLGAALIRSDSKVYRKDVDNLSGIIPLGVIIRDDIEAVKDDFDILIDFTYPDATLTYLNFCLRHRKGIIIGTTGFSDNQKKIIKNAAKEIGIVFSANFSVGINLIIKLLEKTTRLIGKESDIEIMEAHHRHKIDAPSGTAIAMGQVIANALGRNLNDCAIYRRQGHIGKRKEQSIGFTTVRAGDIIGEHTVMFAEFGERLEITHKASSRIIYAKGAVRAAIWLFKKKNGFFTMVDVLNLNQY